MANLILYRGDDRGLEFEWKNPDGSAKDITGATITFTAKLKATDTSPVLTKTTPTDVSIVSAAGGTGRVNIDEADFSTLGKAETELDCSLRLVLAGRTTTERFSLTVVRVP